MDSRKTAIHEAGHAVARVRLGIQNGVTTIITDGQYLGMNTGEEQWGTKEAGEREAIVSCAGYAAVVASGYSLDEAEDGCWQDFDEAVEAIEFWGLGTLDAWKEKTIEFMQDAKNLNAVMVVAKVLEERLTIDEDRLAVLIELADGECSQEEWETFDAFR